MEATHLYRVKAVNGDIRYIVAVSKWEALEKAMYKDEYFYKRISYKVKRIKNF